MQVLGAVMIGARSPREVEPIKSTQAPGVIRCDSRPPHVESLQPACEYLHRYQREHCEAVS